MDDIINITNLVFQFEKVEFDFAILDVYLYFIP